MEQGVNIPIQMLGAWSTVGEIKPLRFRYESEDHQIETVNIESVLAHKDTSFNGVKEIQYTCQAQVFGEKRLFILVYSVSSRKWRLSRMLS